MAVKATVEIELIAAGLTDRLGPRFDLPKNQLASLATKRNAERK